MDDEREKEAMSTDVEEPTDGVDQDIEVDHVPIEIPLEERVAIALFHWEKGSFNGLHFELVPQSDQDWYRSAARAALKVINSVD